MNLKSIIFNHDLTTWMKDHRTDLCMRTAFCFIFVSAVSFKHNDITARTDKYSNCEKDQTGWAN